MKSRSPQLLRRGGTSPRDSGNERPLSADTSTTGKVRLFLLTMNAAYTLPFGPTASAGSQPLPERGSRTGRPKVRPPFVGRAKPIRWLPVFSLYAMARAGFLADWSSVLQAYD